MKDLIIYAAPAITFGLGYLWGKRGIETAQADFVEVKKPSEYWERRYWDERATAAFADHDKAKGIKDMADSQSRLADALAAKNERLERIITKGRQSTSWTAQHLAKIAAGEAK